MILEEVKNYLIENRIASLNELVEHFKTDEDTMREMLAEWEKKGKVRKIEELSGGCSGSCDKCAQCYHLPEEFYTWIN